MSTVDSRTRESTVTLEDAVVLVVRLRRFWIVGALTGFLLAASIAFVTEPTYRAAVTVMPVTGSGGGAAAQLAGQFSALAGLAGITGIDDDRREEALAVIKSQAFTERFIADESLLPVLFHKLWDAERGAWNVDPSRVPTLWDGWNLFDKKIRTVIEDRERNLVTIRIEWRDRQLAARWANTIVDRANRELRERKLAEIDRSLQYVQEELSRAQLMELRQAIAKVMEAQVSSRMIASTRPEYAFRTIDPARPPDADRPVSPKKALWAVLGTVMGSLAGFAIGLTWIYARRRRADTAT